MSKQNILIGAILIAITFFVGFKSGEKSLDLSERFRMGDVVTVEAVYHTTDGTGKNADLVYLVKKNGKRGLVSMDESPRDISEKLWEALRSHEKVSL